MADVDIAKVFADPVFRKFSGVEKIRVLDQLDPNFAALGSPKNKAEAVQKLLHATPMVSRDQGLWHTVGQMAAGIPGQIITASKAATGDIGAMGELALPQLEQLAEAGRIARGRDASAGAISEMVGRGLAGILPGAGPLAAQTGEEIGEGKYGQAGAHVLALLGPSVSRLRLPAARPPTALQSRLNAIRRTPAPQPISPFTQGGPSRVAHAVGRELGMGVGKAAVPPTSPGASGAAGSVLSKIPKVHPIAKFLAKRIPGVGTALDVVEAIRSTYGPDLNVIPKLGRDELANQLYQETHGTAPKTAVQKVAAIKELKAALAGPKIQPATKKMPVPPLRGSSLKRMTSPEKPKGTVPPLRGSSLPPEAPAKPKAPVPPLRGSSIPSEVSVKPKGPIPPLRWSPRAAEAEAATEVEAIPTEPTSAVRASGAAAGQGSDPATGGSGTGESGIAVRSIREQRSGSFMNEYQTRRDLATAQHIVSTEKYGIRSGDDIRKMPKALFDEIISKVERPDKKGTFYGISELNPRGGSRTFSMLREDVAQAVDRLLAGK